MKISLFAYSKKGCETAEKILQALDGHEFSVWCARRLLEEMPEEDLCEEAVQQQQALREVFSPIPKLFRPFYGERFGQSDAMIFVGACGIAVREIAPFVKSKKTDPAVICVDDRARFVIPVLSGHIGGANELAGFLAEKLEAVPVITTATDINGRFSVDTWASKNGFVIDSMKAAKLVSAVILDQDIPVCSELPVKGEYPPGTYAWTPAENEETGVPPIGIFIGWKKEKPFKETLRLVPKVLHLGIGCRKGTESETIRDAVREVLEENGIDKRAVRCAASIELKAEEEGLLQYCREEGLEITFYSAEELMAVPGTFDSSEFVRSITGADNICERSAMIGADCLIVKKTAKNGVTVALAAKMNGIMF